LLTTREPAPKIYAAVSRQYGCAAPTEAIEKRFAEVWHLKNGLSALQGPWAHKNERAFWRQFVKEVFEPYGPLESFDDFVEELRQIFASPSTWRVFPEVPRTLEILKSRGYLLAVISNWDSQLAGLLEGVGLSRYFSAVFVSSLVGWAKPATEIFAAALQHIGVEPHEAVHVGDSAVDDVGGARQAGLQGILLDRLGVYPPDGIPVIQSLSDLPPLLAGGGCDINTSNPS